MQPTPEEIEAGEIDEDVLEELDEKLELDYQVGEDLKERVSWPNTNIQIICIDHTAA